MLTLLAFAAFTVSGALLLLLITSVVWLLWTKTPTPPPLVMCLCIAIVVLAVLMLVGVGN